MLSGTLDWLRSGPHSCELIPQRFPGRPRAAPAAFSGTQNATTLVQSLSGRQVARPVWTKQRLHPRNRCTICCNLLGLLHARDFCFLSVLDMLDSRATVLADRRGLKANLLVLSRSVRPTRRASSAILYREGIRRLIRELTSQCKQQAPAYPAGALACTAARHHSRRRSTYRYAAGGGQLPVAPPWGRSAWRSSGLPVVSFTQRAGGLGHGPGLAHQQCPFRKSQSGAPDRTFLPHAQKLSQPSSSFRTELPYRLILVPVN